MLPCFIFHQIEFFKQSKQIHIIKINAFTEQWNEQILMPEFDGHDHIGKFKTNKQKCPWLIFGSVRGTLTYADFEYFRQRAWMSKTILEDYVKNVHVDSGVEELERKLRDVAAELTRTGL